MFQSNDQMQHITKSNVRGGSGSPGFCYLFTEAQLGGRAGIPNLATVTRFLEDGVIEQEWLDERLKRYRQGFFDM